MIERIVATDFPALFDDTRSDNKGPGPVGLTIGEVGGRVYALVALERSNMKLTFDVTDPARVTYTGAAQRAGGVSPEGALFIAAEDSPTGEALYVASNEVSSSISVFALEQTPAFTLQLLHFADAEAGLLASRTAPNLAAQQASIAPSAVVQCGTEIVGLVGATTQIPENIASTGGVEVEGLAGDGAETNDMALLAAQLQPVIDDLRDQGVNKIILMAHLQQLAFEVELAGLLRGVDAILAAGSNTRLGDDTDAAVAFPGPAADFAGPYPILATGADGNTTLIVNTDNEYTYLGRLVVAFDGAGNIVTDSLDPAINGAYAATDANVAAAWGVAEADLATTAFAEGTKGEQVADVTEAVQAVINAKDGETWGFTEVYLEGERNIVRNQETKLGNVSADANLGAARTALGEAELASASCSMTERRVRRSTPRSTSPTRRSYRRMRSPSRRRCSPSPPPTTRPPRPPSTRRMSRNPRIRASTT
jgi:hypothetical protein